MSILTSLAKRRSYYALGRELPVTEEQIVDSIRRATELVPDAFNMKSSRVVVALGQRHEELWDAVEAAFEGKLPHEKIEGFRQAAGTVLYFYDRETLRRMQEQFPTYAENFPVWANQSSGMLQLSVWTALRDLGLGASLQHYNPVIDLKVQELFDLPTDYQLLAQMPFGQILAEPEPKPAEDIDQRVQIRR